MKGPPFFLRPIHGSGPLNRNRGTIPRTGLGHQFSGFKPNQNWALADLVLILFFFKNLSGTGNPIPDPWAWAAISLP